MSTQSFPHSVKSRVSGEFGACVIVNNTHQAARQTLAPTHASWKNCISHSTHVFKGPRRLLKHIHNLSASAPAGPSIAKLASVHLYNFVYLPNKHLRDRLEFYAYNSNSGVLHNLVTDSEVREIGECRVCVREEDAGFVPKLDRPWKKSSPEERRE